jgi:hypothetical protein
MQGPQSAYRECVDCYYRVDGRCTVMESKGARRNVESPESCDMFTRASLRFAFFPKM